VQADSWAIGEAYEPYVGRWSRLVAREFLQWIEVGQGARWLDVGCGTGALTDLVLETASPAMVCGVDPAPAFVHFARSRVRDPRAAFVVGDARSLPHRSACVDAVVSALALNFIPRCELALAEMVRVAAEGALVAAYVWDYAGQMQLMRYFWDAVVVLDRDAAELDEARRFPICDPAVLEALFRQAGLRGVECRAIDVPTRFRDFDDYWNPFLGGQGPAPGYAMALSEARRAALRERIRESLPVAGDGSINLTARAWAARGQRA
jgi:SAM-dependent methyltransferase